MKYRVLVFLSTMSFILGSLCIPAQATQPGVSCVSDFGTKVPVLMVHGLYGEPLAWGDESMPGSMYAAVSDGRVIQDTFGYKNVNKEWITHPDIGPKLAQQIDCLSQNSLAGRGKGKVIVLAHSMGSLAAQYAVNQTVNGRKLADNAWVITIGAPNEGSSLASLCEELAKVKVTPDKCKGSAIPALKAGSKELAELPPFPLQVPVKTLSGNVTINTIIYPSLGPVPVYIPVPTQSDLVVGLKQAGRFATSSGKGDGKREFACNGWIPVPSFSDAPCEHSNMLKMPEVQQEVKATIEKYISVINTPAIPPTNFFGLSLRIGSDWQVLKASDDTFANGRKIITWKKTCGPQDYKMYCPGFVVAKMNGADPKVPYKPGVSCNYDQVHDDLGWSAPKVVGTVTVGGVQGEHFTQENNCRFDEGTIQPKQGGDTLHGWRFPSKKVIVYDSEGTEQFSKQPFPRVEDLLMSASWT